MIYRYFSGVALCLSVAILPTTASAQASAPSTAVDVSLGFARMFSSAEQEIVGVFPTLDLTIGRWRAGSQHGNVGFAGSLGLNHLGARDWGRTSRSSGDRSSVYAGFNSVSALASWQSQRGRFRVFAGPTLAYGDEAALGLQGRIDIAAPVTQRLSLTLNGRAFALPSLQGASYQLLDVGFGLRIVERGLR